MSWRSIFISQPANLSYKNQALLIKQQQGEAQVALEDIAAIVLDNPQINLTAKLLSECANKNIAIISTDSTHTPNGVFLSFTPHSRALKILQQQIGLSLPNKKRLWQQIVVRKINNQAWVLEQTNNLTEALLLRNLANQVKSGDPANLEAQAARAYFKALFGKNFARSHDNLINAGLNYGYSILRSAIARSLVAYGFLPVFGLHHHNELNSFNLADDLIEPYRPHLDFWLFNLLQQVSEEQSELDTHLKSQLVNFLNQDLPRFEFKTYLGASTVLSLIDASVISLKQSLTSDLSLVLPGEFNE